MRPSSTASSPTRRTSRSSTWVPCPATASGTSTAACARTSTARSTCWRRRGARRAGRRWCMRRPGATLGAPRADGLGHLPGCCRRFLAARRRTRPTALPKACGELLLADYSRRGFWMDAGRARRGCRTPKQPLGCFSSVVRGSPDVIPCGQLLMAVSPAVYEKPVCRGP